jgi:hypothetical protein
MPDFEYICMVKPVLDRKFDRNADTLQQTITDPYKQEPALGATGRTATNSHGQSMPYPPFGTPRLSPSTNVHSKLHKPRRYPHKSIKIRCCLPILLSIQTQ